MNIDDDDDPKVRRKSSKLKSGLSQALSDFIEDETVERVGRSLGLGLFHLRSDLRFQDVLRRMNFPP